MTGLRSIVVPKGQKENASNTADLEFGLEHTNPRIDPSGQGLLVQTKGAGMMILPDHDDDGSLFPRSSEILRRIRNDRGEHVPCGSVSSKTCIRWRRVLIVYSFCDHYPLDPRLFPVTFHLKAFGLSRSLLGSLNALGIDQAES